MDKETAILIGLAVYAVLMIAVALYCMSRVRQAADYLVAGRTLPWYVLTGTITATCVGTGVVVGSSGTAYEYGWAGSAYPIALGLGTLLAGLLFARMRRFNFVTLSEEIASYYDNNRLVVEFSNISLFASQLFWLTTQILGGAVVLTVVTGLSPTWCIVLSGIIIAAIAIPGGLKAVAYTDTLQAIILLIGLTCLTYSALEASGGAAGMSARVPPAYKSFLGYKAYGAWNLINLMVVVCLSVIADPGRRLSMFSARSEAGARWSMVVGGAIVMAFSLIIGVIGMYAYELNPNLPQRDQAVPWLVMNVLPAWLAAFVVVSIASATFSSASTNAIAAGTYFVRHIYPLFTGGRYAKRPLVAVRLALVVAFVLSTLVALQAGNIVEFVKFFLPLTMSGLAIIILLGLWWPRATWQGALAALITTPAVTLLVPALGLKAVFFKDPAIAAALAGVAAHVVVSLLTPRSRHTFAETAATLQGAREQAMKSADPQAGEL